jgi:adenine-specific DNA-methyltransferase
MEKRLIFAKKLLKKDGVIFISIDDNEQAQLKILCDGIFGGENFLVDFIWNKKNVVQNDAKFSSINHEYVLSYRKSYERESFELLERTDNMNNRYANPDHDFKGDWTSVALQAKSGSKANLYEIEFPNGVKWKPVSGTFPRLSKNSLEKAYNENRLWFGKSGKNVPRLKKYLSEVKQGVVTNSIWGNDEVGSTQIGKEDIKKILGENIFETPKPKELIKKCINLSTRYQRSIILDFMAGSGTTGHAVLDLNKEDGGNRKFILCTNNELNGLEKELHEKGLSEEEIEEHGICRRITHKRIEKVMKGYTKPNGEKVKGLGGNLEYFKTEFVDVENIDKVSDKKKLEFTYEAGQMIALKEDAFKEIVKNKFYQIFTDEKEKFVGIYFRENLDKLLEMEKKILDKKDVKLYLFSHGVNDFKKDYSEYKNVTVKDIPEPILKIYKSLNN